MVVDCILRFDLLGQSFGVTVTVSLERKTYFLLVSIQLSDFLMLANNTAKREVWLNKAYIPPIIDRLNDWLLMLQMKILSKLLLVSGFQRKE